MRRWLRSPTTMRGECAGWLEMMMRMTYARTASSSSAIASRLPLLLTAMIKKAGQETKRKVKRVTTPSPLVPLPR